MPTRVAATLSLLAFAVCLVAGGFGAGNPFATVVWRALLAMGGTFAVGLVVGVMAQKMIEESAAAQARRLAAAREERVKALAGREPILEVGSDGPTADGRGVAAR